MPKKFDQEAKDRVVRLVEDRILAENTSTQEACKIVAPKLGVSWHTARQWTQAARREGRVTERLPEDLVAEVAKLRRENPELRDTNELLKAASAFFRVGTRPQTSEMTRFIDEHRNRLPVEFICKTLKNNRAGGFITSRGYRQSKARGLSARRLHDAMLIERISAVHRDNYGVYGVRKIWRVLRRQGIDIGREQTARLMRTVGLSGKGKGGAPITTRKPKGPDLRPDLVNCEFKAPGPNRLWVADITYVRTRKGFVYTALVTVVFSRRIVGWALSDSMRTEALPLQALNQAIVCAKETTGLVHLSDHGSQYVSIVYNERLAEPQITASTGTVGDSYDNALAENVNGSYKKELIHARSWNDVVDVEIATFEWVNWWNESRLHQSLGYRTPTEVEAGFWEHHPSQEIMEIKAQA
ncbi:IS3 family transposase [Corynebacterium striatum]|uniref:IS3 family transposase n=1 Tax=Corynebacterium striatum TaxID=43770 RepID=UPI001A1BCF87|nr:IS3 family transposase [Corynebacterium striatum]HAT1177104.1 IS3 family transposase [Corynebacterium striatum]HAT1329352.1 IS3 family transposase [Corynebacterium striatum]HAT1331837.1 IS3 family transposase [Corynebacterium striatum]HAT1339189.1 IS3 family transposase [Corynebacterium striatum]